MSNEVKEIDLNLDLAFLPAWAQESPEINRYANYEGEREGRRGGAWERGPRRDRPPGDRPRGPRPQRDGRREGGRENRDRDRDRNQDRGPRGRPGGGGRPGRGGPRGGGRPPFEKRPELPPLDVEIGLVPEAKGVESLARQIRITGRAYPLFDIARLILQKDDRFEIELRVKKLPDGKVAQPLFSCVLDDTVWLSEDEAVNHVLEKHFATFYQVEKTPTEPPKGTYTFVAQCGMSGTLLGPPNYHDYQNKLHKLHQERFANMPFERFRSRVKIVRDEEVVKKWIEEQSFKTEYIVLNVPEPVKLQSMDEVREHFRSVHLPNIVKSVERVLSPTANARRNGARHIQRHVAHEIDQQRRFPLKLATSLSQQFAGKGLQFFKVDKTIVHVSVARPHYLDIETEPVSEGVKKIVQFVNAHPRCTVKDLVDDLAPTPKPGDAEALAATPAATAESTPADAPVAPPPEHPKPTDAQNAVLSDLHWLVHSGHVIEFASGELETAKKPLPKPPPAPKKMAAEKPEESAAKTAETLSTTEPVAASTSEPHLESAVQTEPAPAGEEPIATAAAPTEPAESAESAGASNVPIPPSEPTA